MKIFSKTIAAILSALVMLSCAVPAVSAAQTAPCPQIRVIRCDDQDCSDVKGLLDQLCSRRGICLNDILKTLNSYCPGGDCRITQPAPAPQPPTEAPTKTAEKPAAPVEKPTEPVVAPTAPAAPAAPESTEFNTAYEAEVLRLVNIERAKYGLAALSSDSGAVKVAHLRAKEIVRSFSHTRPDGSSCFTAAKEFGVSYRTAGENIAYGYATPAQVVNGWMNSEGHRKNILSASFSKIGVGCYQSGNTLYWSQFFIG